MPLAIPRPDYADHPAGRSACEETLKGKIKKLTGLEILRNHNNVNLPQEIQQSRFWMMKKLKE